MKSVPAALKPLEDVHGAAIAAIDADGSGKQLEQSRRINFREDERSLLLRLLLQVASAREPEIAAVLTGRRSLVSLAAEQRIPALQASGVWFQLLAIADELFAMRARRELEQGAGVDEVPRVLRQRDRADGSERSVSGRSPGGAR